MVSNLKKYSIVIMIDQSIKLENDLDTLTEKVRDRKRSTAKMAMLILEKHI